LQHSKPLFTDLPMMQILPVVRRTRRALLRFFLFDTTLKFSLY
jgi:hypothetical protein